MNLENLFIHL